MTRSMLLAGDVGGTKTSLALFHREGRALKPLRQDTLPSGDFPTLEAVIAAFLGNDRSAVAAASLGVAGPVARGISHLTNLGWVISEMELGRSLAIPRVKLLNDLEAMALGMLHLENEDWVELNAGVRTASGNKAVIAAGTGLGEAILYWDGQNYHSLPTEGGHADFAPNDAQEDNLLRGLRQRFGGHVSYERILSGPGLVNVYRHLCESGFAPEPPELRRRLDESADPARLISEYGLQGSEPLCAEALRLFVRIYGAEAGNLALHCLPRGGVLVGGGIAPKILPALQSGEFMRGFTAKGRFANLLSTFPVKVALHANPGLLGAAHCAASLTA